MQSLPWLAPPSTCSSMLPEQVGLTGIPGLCLGQNHAVAQYVLDSRSHKHLNKRASGGQVLRDPRNDTNSLSEALQSGFLILFARHWPFSPQAAENAKEAIDLTPSISQNLELCVCVCRIPDKTNWQEMLDPVLPERETSQKCCVVAWFQRLGTSMGPQHFHKQSNKHSHKHGNSNKRRNKHQQQQAQ